MMTSSSSTLLPQPLHTIIGDVVEQYNQGGAEMSKVVKFKDVILDACEKYGFLYEQEMHVKQMGCHPSNRDKEGIHPKRSQSRVSTIFDIGFSWRAIKENLVGVEDHPLKRHIAKNTMNVISRSVEYAQYVENEIKGGTLGAGHATHGFAQVFDERPCTIDNVSENGKMSKRKCYKDEGIKNACEKGLRFRMVKWEVEEVFPQACVIIQAALNTITQMAEGTFETSGTKVFLSKREDH